MGHFKSKLLPTPQIGKEEKAEVRVPWMQQNQQKERWKAFPLSLGLVQAAVIMWTVGAAVSRVSHEVQSESLHRDQEGKR